MSGASVTMLILAGFYLGYAMRSLRDDDVAWGDVVKAAGLSIAAWILR